MNQAIETSSHIHLFGNVINVASLFPHATLFSESDCSVLASVRVEQIRSFPRLSSVTMHGKARAVSFSSFRRLEVVFVLGQYLVDSCRGVLFAVWHFLLPTLQIIFIATSRVGRLTLQARKTLVGRCRH